MHAEPERPIPTPILVGGGLVMLVSLLVVASARTGLAPRQAPPVAAVTARLDFRLQPQADGLALRRAGDGRLLAVLNPKSNDFLPILTDKLEQERALRHASPNGVLELRRWSDGRVSLNDPETGRDLELDSFGAGNAAAAGRLITEGGRA